MGDRRIVEELCTDSQCPTEGTHWHPLDPRSFLKEKPGEYTITVRVRYVPKSKVKAMVRQKRP